VLLVLPSHTATWYFHYDVVLGNGRTRRKVKIGRLDEVPLAQAIASAEAYRPCVREGADPAEKRSERVPLTFWDLAEARFATGDPLRPGTESDYRLVLGRDVLPAIGRLPASGVTRQHVIDIVNAVAMRGAARRADTTRIVIGSIYAFGIDRGLVEHNPASDMRNRHAYRPRDVVASTEVIRRLWFAIDDGEAVMTPAMGTIVRLALLTGQRRGEIAGVRKSDLELDGERPTLTIPRGRAKNRLAHRVPLSPQARQLLEAACAKAGESPFVFPGMGANGSISPRSVSKAMERTRAKLGFSDITVHDLRRTVGSYLTRYGVPKDVRQRVLNHGGLRAGGVTDSVYGWYDYDPEKRAALELWAEALVCILEGTNAQIDDYNARLASLKGAGTVRVVG
jgi:integrase